jgi:3-oxoadipate enol-lactonase
MDRDDLAGRLAGITCPTLIVHGTAGAAIPVARAEAVRDGLNGPVTFIAVDGAAHASNLTHPDEVNRAILEFMSGLDAG